jgi:hypothetical protein
LLAVSFDDLMAAAFKEQQQQQASSSSQTTSSPAAAGSGSSRSQQPAAEPLRATGAFTGTASQSRPIPLHVLEQEYEMVHQVRTLHVLAAQRGE